MKEAYGGGGHGEAKKKRKNSDKVSIAFPFLTGPIRPSVLHFYKKSYYIISMFFRPRDEHPITAVVLRKRNVRTTAQCFLRQNRTVEAVTQEATPEGQSASSPKGKQASHLRRRCTRHSSTRLFHSHITIPRITTLSLSKTPDSRWV